MPIHKEIPNSKIYLALFFTKVLILYRCVLVHESHKVVWRPISKPNFAYVSPCPHNEHCTGTSCIRSWLKDSMKITPYIVSSIPRIDGDNIMVKDCCTCCQVKDISAPSFLVSMIRVFRDSIGLWFIAPECICNLLNKKGS